MLSGQTLEMVTQPQVCRGRPIGRVWAFRDRTELVNADRRIEALITTDALTGLPNRRCSATRWSSSLAHAQRDRAGFALLLLDLDRFKQINDSLGSEAGDRVLIEVAERGKTCLRQGDMLARVGGDQFALLVHRADQRGAEAAAAACSMRSAAPMRSKAVSSRSPAASALRCTRPTATTATS